MEELRFVFKRFVRDGVGENDEVRVSHESFVRARARKSTRAARREKEEVKKKVGREKKTRARRMRLSFFFARFLFSVVRGSGACRRMQVVHSRIESRGAP